MPAHLEITGGIIRFSHRPDWQYGEPFEFAIYVDPVDAETVALKGFQGVPPIRLIHELKALLRSYGWKTVMWERYRNGKRCSVSRSLAPSHHPHEGAASAVGRLNGSAAHCSGIASPTGPVDAAGD